MLKSIKQLSKWWYSYLAYRDAMKGSKYFEKHPHLQERLEIIEDWCEELEVRLDELQEKGKQ
jgi:hypothetical protein